MFTTRTVVKILYNQEREIEIAKMISGSIITNEAVLMVKKLIES